MMPRRAERISDDYLAQQRALHLLPQGYGGKGSRWASTVASLAKATRSYSVLDYGCGRGSLRPLLSELAPLLDVREYDPAIPGKDGDPIFADLVVCTDVLEHVEPDKIGNVLRHLRCLARKAVFLVVCLRPANKDLPDGRNAHLLLRSAHWWDTQIQEAWFERLPVDVALPEKVNAEKQWIAVVRPC